MSERFKLCGQKKRERFKLLGVDRLSQLPNELLVKVLSDLSVKHAGQTSILSSRWKTLWKFTTGELDFRDPVAESNPEFRALDEARKKFTRWVNKVTNLHKGGQIEGFKVCFDLDVCYKSDIDRWIEFAVQNRSPLLDIDLRRFFQSRKKGNLYPFPNQVLSHSNIKLVTHFALFRVDVSGRDLHNVLSNCVLLRVLIVSESDKLSGGITVSGPNLLKFIQVQHCNNVKFIDISAADLEVIVFAGPSTTNICIRHAPILDTLNLGGYYCANHFPLYPEISAFFNQIDYLHLDYSDGYIYDKYHKFKSLKFPEFKNLKFLTFNLCTFDLRSLLSSMSLFKECPMLETLVVGFVWVDEVRALYTKMKSIELKDKEKLKCLKQVEFNYFGGHRVDVELVSCILGNAPNIETIIFRNPYTQDPPPMHFPLPLYRIDEGARARARELANKHSPAARLYFLS